jgi:Family of unknown function (DUF6308)
MLTGVLVATVRDPSRPGPGAKLHSGLESQGDVGVAGNPRDFHAGAGVPPGILELHRKRPALIPMLDSVVQAYLTRDDPETRSSGSFGERATALVRSYKRDLDRNHSVLHGLQRELASRTYPLTEVRILDLMIWSVSAAT